MTGNQIITAFREFVGDSLSSEIELSLANQARIELETELQLQCSKRLDTSQTVQSGNTYTTNYTLSANALMPAGNFIYVGTERFTGVPLEERELYKNETGYFYIDLYNSRFHLTGTPTAGQTITFPYIDKGTDIAADNNTVLKYPTGTHIIIPMHMARTWFAIDQGEKGRSWLPEWETFYQRTKKAIVNWDAKWKLASIGGATPYGERPRNTTDTLNID